MRLKSFAVICICLSLFSCKKEVYAEPTEAEIIEYTKKYIIDSYKVQARTLKIFNIDELDDYYVNHTVDTLPDRINKSVIYILDDDIKFKKIEFDSEKEKIIDGKKEKVKLYFVTFSVYQYERYHIDTKTYETRNNQYDAPYVVITFKDQIKIYGDPDLSALNIRKSDLPIALQGLAEGKVIQTR